MNDVVISTSDGQLLFFNFDGAPLNNYTYQVDLLHWY